jgi:hypothetical protein
MRLHPIGPSMICSGCDGQMVFRKDAIGRDYLRCPTCSPFARDPVRHPDDAMLPQGLVRTDAVRVVREIVRVEVPVPAPPPERVVELPPINPGQVRCQLCAVGVDPRSRFCPKCAKDGNAIVSEVRELRRNRGTRANRHYRETRCRFVGCETWFTPSGPFARYCEVHR